LTPHISIEMSINGPGDIGVSRTAFFAGSLSAFGGGLLYGVYKVFKKEKTKINVKAQKPLFMLAFRALGYGTALCFGSFAAAGAAFIYTTKITTLNDFDVWARQVGAQVPIPRIEETSESRAEAEQAERELNAFVESFMGESGKDGGEQTEVVK
jgi:hypothetical protein